MKKYDWETFDSPADVVEFLDKNQNYNAISVTVSVIGKWTVFYYYIPEGGE